jgi:proline iminopeptidase
MDTIDRRGFLAAGTAAILGAALPAGAGGEAGAAGLPGPAPAEVKTAGIRLIPVDGKYNVWTKRVGASKVKMLTLHGGPGATHEYLE